MRRFLSIDIFCCTSFPTLNQPSVQQMRSALMNSGSLSRILTAAIRPLSMSVPPRNDFPRKAARSALLPPFLILNSEITLENLMMWQARFSCRQRRAMVMAQAFAASSGNPRIEELVSTSTITGPRMSPRESLSPRRCELDDSKVRQVPSKSNDRSLPSSQLCSKRISVSGMESLASSTGSARCMLPPRVIPPRRSLRV